MKKFVYCGEGIGYICDIDEEVPEELLPYTYIVYETEESDED